MGRRGSEKGVEARDNVFLFGSLLGRQLPRRFGRARKREVCSLSGRALRPTDDLYCVRDGCKALRHQGIKG
jgi:hypothetical protein